MTSKDKLTNLLFSSSLAKLLLSTASNEEDEVII